MKVFKILDEKNSSAEALVYLVYYEKSKKFYAEIPDDADPWQIPILFSCLMKKGIFTVDSYWTEKWVKERIIPMDRQNLGAILRDNGLDEYDEFKLLELSEGRCAQDYYYIKPASEEELFSKFEKRYNSRVEDAFPISDFEVLVALKNNCLILIDIRELAEEDDRLSRLIAYRELLEKVEVQPGGYGICWGENFRISEKEIHDKGKNIPLTADAFRRFVRHSIISTAEAAKELECSRQNIACLVASGSLNAIKEDPKNKYFLKSDVKKRLWT